MKKDLFTFSIQEAETLGIECAIVLAATKNLTASLSSPSETADLIKEKISFLDEEEIINHLKRLVDLKLVSFAQKTQIKESTATKNLYKLKLPGNNLNSGKRKLDYSWSPSIQAFEVLEMGKVNKEFIASKVNEFKMFGNCMLSISENKGILRYL